MGLKELLAQKKAASQMKQVVQPSQQVAVPAASQEMKTAFQQFAEDAMQPQIELPTVPLECSEKLAAAHPVLVQAIEELRTALILKNPNMPTYLREIHAACAQFPELAHLLSDEQAAVVYQAWLKQTATAFVAPAGKSGRAKKTAEKIDPNEAMRMLQDMQQSTLEEGKPIDVNDLFG